MSKLQLPAAYNTKTQFYMQQSARCSRISLYGRFYFYLQRKLHVAVERTTWR